MHACASHALLQRRFDERIEVPIQHLLRRRDLDPRAQIRSYVLDNSRIKDLRTGVEISATQKVLDGDLDAFIEASLKQGV